MAGQTGTGTRTDGHNLKTKKINLHKYPSPPPKLMVTNSNLMNDFGPINNSVVPLEYFVTYRK